MGDDTPTAILTKGQREYLRGEREPAQKRTMETRIRRRVQLAFTEDVALLTEAADPEDLIEGADLKEFREGLESTTRLIYKLADVAGHDPDALIDEAVQGLRHSRADEIWEALEEGDIRAGLEELKILRDGGRIPEGVHAEAFKKCLGKPEGLTHEDVVEVWREVEG